MNNTTQFPMMSTTPNVTESSGSKTSGKLTLAKDIRLVTVGGIEAKLVPWNVESDSWKYELGPKKGNGPTAVPVIITTKTPTVAFNRITGEWRSAEGHVRFYFKEN